MLPFTILRTEQTSNPVTVDSSRKHHLHAPSTAATGYELRVIAADVGKFKSTTTTATFEVTAHEPSPMARRPG